MLESKEIEIAGRAYVVSTLAASKGIPLCMRLPRILAGPIGGALGAVLSGGGIEGALAALESIGPELLASSLREFAERLAEPGTMELCYGFLEAVSTAIDPSKPQKPITRGAMFDACFTGSPLVMLRVVFESMRVNAGNFTDAFPELGGLLAAARKTSAKSPTHPQTSPGK